jgi:hypothetical protein
LTGRQPAPQPCGPRFHIVAKLEALDPLDRCLTKSELSLGIDVRSSGACQAGVEAALKSTE